MSQDELKKVSECVNNLQETIKKLSSNLSDMKDDPKDKIYLQLHEQYAINNNANLSTIMTLVIALIGVIGYYGYVFMNTSNEFNWKSFQLYDSYKNVFSVEALILVCIASIFILSILFCLCTYQGIAQRKEQFIIHDIRRRYNIDNDSILPETYNPYFKKGFATIQGLYGELVRVFLIVSILLVCVSVIRVIIANIICNCDNCCAMVIDFVILAIISFVLYGCCDCYYQSQYSSYIDRQINYIKKDLEEDQYEKGLVLAINEIISKIDSNNIKTYKDNVDDMKNKLKELRESRKMSPTD